PPPAPPACPPTPRSGAPAPGSAPSAVARAPAAPGACPIARRWERSGRRRLRRGAPRGGGRRRSSAGGAGGLHELEEQGHDRVDAAAGGVDHQRVVGGACRGGGPAAVEGVAAGQGLLGLAAALGGTATPPGPRALGG